MAPNNNRNLKQRFTARFGRSPTTLTATTTTNSELNHNATPPRPNRTAAPSATGIALLSSGNAGAPSASGAPPIARRGLIQRSKSRSPISNGGSFLARPALQQRDDDASSVMVESVPPQNFSFSNNNSKRGTVRSVRSSLRSSMKKVSGSSSKNSSSSSSSSGNLLKSRSSANPAFDDPEMYPEDVYLARKSDRRSGVRSALTKIGSRKVASPTFTSSSSSSKRSSNRVSNKKLSKSEQDLEENRSSRASTNPKFEAPAVVAVEPTSSAARKSSSSVSGKRNTGKSSRAKALFLGAKVKAPRESGSKNKKNNNNVKSNKNKNTSVNKSKKDKKNNNNNNEATASPIAQPVAQHVIKSAQPSTPTEFTQQEPVAVDSAADSEVRQKFKDTYRVAKHSGPAYTGRSNKGGPGNRTMKFYVGEQLVEQCRA